MIHEHFRRNAIFVLLGCLFFCIISAIDLIFSAGWGFGLNGFIAAIGFTIFGVALYFVIEHLFNRFGP